MKRFFLMAAIAATLVSCGDAKEKTASTTEDKKETPAADLPYKANYTSNFSMDVSDADLKTVLDSYKDWEKGDLAHASTFYRDTIMWERNNGDKKAWTNADLMKEWKTYRDSLSSVEIKFTAWDKAYAVDTKEPYVLAWYIEIDTYKDGRVDSAEFHDINGLKEGKIGYYSQFRRALK